MLDWQTFVSLCIVAVALAVLLRKLFLSFKTPAGGCGSCSSCPNDSNERGGALKATQLVQIDDGTA